MNRSRHTRVDAKRSHDPILVSQTQLETAPPHELKNIFQMLQELLVSDVSFTILSI